MEQTFEDPSMRNRSRRFITQCIRVLRITKKPTKEEYRVLLKISLIGIAAIGLIGFALFLIKELLLPF